VDDGNLMGSFVRVLEGSGLDPGEVGGKAAALDRLIAYGFPVPPCAAVTTSAYRAAALDPHVIDLVGELRSMPAPPPAQAGEALQRVERVFAGLALPDTLERELMEVGERIANGSRLAVRSSATSEDATLSSAAGQYRSILDVHPADLPDALRKVWASLWSPHARSYREAQGMDGETAMGVVIMRMVDPDHAGVLFTTDPRGRATDMRIELVEGRADELVSGRRTPRSIVVARARPRHVPDDVGPLADRLADLGLDVEEYLGDPQDIEWVARGDDVLLVQARPITAVSAPSDDGFDSPISTTTRYTTAGIAEALPGVLSPLLWSLNGPMMEEAFRTLFANLGSVPPVDDRVIVRVRARAAINLDLLASIATATGGSTAEFERQYLGMAVSDEEDGQTAVSQTKGRVKLVKASSRAARLRHALGRETAALRRAIDDVVDANIRVETLGPSELIAYRDHIHDLAARAVVAQVATAVAAVAAFRALETYLFRYLGNEAAVLAQEVTAGETGASGGAAVLGLDDVMADIDADWLRSVVVSSAGDVEAVERRLEGSRTGRELVRAVHRAAFRAGSRAVFAGPTWDEDMSEVWKVLEARLQAPPSPQRTGEGDRSMLRDLERRLASTPRWRLTRILTGQIVDVRLGWLRRLVDEARRWLPLREEMKLAVLRLGGQSRRTARRAGQLLEEAGVIDHTEDVELMSDMELVEALHGNPPSRGRLPGRRRALARAHDLDDLPRVFAGLPSWAAGGPGARDERRSAAEEGSDMWRLEGWAASSGSHRGRPRVVVDASSAHLQPGDVLVARTTDPSWTSLFLIAGAIVVEEGGPLSHAAILARELGVPAVVNVPDATSRLEAVAWVTVDGDSGVVRVHASDDEPDSHAAAPSTHPTGDGVAYP
jgi:rifampicin phosphotransferase